MTAKISRRHLVQGAAWAAPVVLATAAVPAYASSVPQNLEYWSDGAWEGKYKAGCNTTITISNSNSYYDPYYRVTYSAGFRISYDDGTAVDTTATIVNPLYVVMLPKGTTDSFTVQSGPWEYVGKTNPATYAGPSETVINTSGYDVFTFKFTGELGGPVLTDSALKPWPGSDQLVATATSSGCLYNSIEAYGGYTMGYTTHNGFSSPRANLISRQSFKLI